MKYLITEKQLKTLRKYMKSFINEYSMDDYIQGIGNPKNPIYQSDELSEDDNIRIVTITYNGKKIAKATIDYDANEIYTDFDTNNRDMNNSIEDRLDELKAGGMGVVDIKLDGDTITYDELMDRSDEN
jgi:hypothetical protein